MRKSKELIERLRAFPSGTNHQHCHEAADALEAMSDRTCKWTLDYDEWESSWDTECGNKWEFTNDGPKENNCKFCMYCGGALAALEKGDD